MSWLRQVGTFASAIYGDSRLKNRIIFWTYIGLVLPAALLVAMGVSEKSIYPIVVALILPLQFALYCLHERSKRQ